MVLTLDLASLEYEIQNELRYFSIVKSDSNVYETLKRFNNSSHLHYSTITQYTAILHTIQSSINTNYSKHTIGLKKYNN